MPATRKHPTRAEQIAERCVHFTGTSDDTCKAGIRYESVTLKHDPVPGVGYGATRSLPCIDRFNHCGATCPRRLLRTEDEVAAQVAEEDRQLQAMFEARGRIIEETKGQRGVRGTVECPSCSGRLHFTVSSYNGHIWGKCETQGCLAWME